MGPPELLPEALYITHWFLQPAAQRKHPSPVHLPWSTAPGLLSDALPGERLLAFALSTGKAASRLVAILL